MTAVTLNSTSTPDSTAEAATEATKTTAPQPIGPLLPVVGGTLQAPLVTGRGVRHVNLDYAASAPALQAVADHVAEALPFYASVHRGAGYASQVSTNLFESARTTIADFVGARADDVVIFTRNTTDSLTLLASAVPVSGEQRGEVLVLDLEHHANLLPWTTSGPAWVLPVADTLAETLAELEAALAARPISLVAITGCSNVTGELLPVTRIAALAHRYGARIVVDGAQLVPHRRVDLAAAGIDYLAFSGHKLYAPFGAGVLVGRRDWLDAAAPYLPGGGAVREVRADGTAVWAAAPQRHEGGTPNVLGVAAVAAACRAIAALPEGALTEHEDAIATRLRAGLAAIPGVQLLRLFRDSPADSTEQAGVVGFAVEGYEAGLVAAYLSAEHGIGVRDGKFCAHPLVERLGHGSGALRASIGVGSRSEDAARLVSALRQLVEHGPQWQYEVVDGRWTPTPDPRELPAGGQWPAWRPDGRATGVSPCAR
jgi:selenocysteine lyase/cysteine desulfurase